MTNKPRKPRGLNAAGSRLWETVNDTFDMDDEPHKVEILTHACRVSDTIATLERAAAKQPLTVRGSAGQQVIQPLIGEARAQRALLNQLIARLALPDSEEEIESRQDELSRKRAQAGRRFRLA